MTDIYAMKKTSPKNKDRSGIVLVDILVAFSLGILFVVVITTSSNLAHDIFDFAYGRNALLDLYDAHKSEFDNMMPYETRHINYIQSHSTTSIKALARWYGNDRIETNLTISVGGASSTKYTQSMVFHSVRGYPFLDNDDAQGTPLCSVDFTGSRINFDPVISSIILPIDPNLPLTDIEVRDGIAYISSDSNNASDPDLLIVNIRDIKNANVISAINTGPGLTSITLAGNRVYGAAASTASQLHIIRMDSLSSPVLERKFQLPLPYATATAPNSSSIFYNKGKIYLGTEKWGGDEFSVVDVSNPLAPNRVGGLETNSKVNDIFVRDSRAYISDSDERQLRVADVSNAGVQNILDSFSPSGWQRQEGKSLSYFEDGLVFGRTSGGFNIKNDNELFSWQNIPSSSPPISNTTQSSVDIPGGVYGIVTDRNHVYIATKQPGHELQIYDRSVSTTTAKSFPLSTTPQAMTCDGANIYILTTSSPIIFQITFI